MLVMENYEVIEITHVETNKLFSFSWPTKNAVRLNKR